MALTDEQREERQLRLEFFRKYVEVDHPESDFYVVAFNPDGINMQSFAFGNTDAIGCTIQSVAEDVEQSHRWGRCSGCDRRAQAVVAAYAAYRQVMDASEVQRETKN